MPTARTRTFRSGSSKAIRLPEDVAFGEDVELIVVRSGNVLTVYPATVITRNADDFDDLPGLRC